MIATLQGRSGVSGILASSEFYAPMYDLGSGAVDTTLARGVGSATFTRATTAWTKLSTGLWASVASGTARSSYIGLTTAASAYGGYFAEGAGTQLVTPTASIRDMTNAAWTKGATMTAAKTGTGIDGVVNSCSRLTGGAVSATNTAFQTLVAAASSRTYSCWIQRVTGTGTINITQDGGSTYTDVTSLINASTFTLVQLTASVLNAAFGIQVVTNGDVILVDFNQFEAGAFATSPMDAAGAVRNADLLSYGFTGNASQTAGTVYTEANTLWTTQPTTVAFVATDGALQLYQNISAASTAIRAFDGTNTANKTGLTDMATASRKRASSWGSAGLAVTGDGAAPDVQSFDGSVGGTTSVLIGNNGTTGVYAMQKNIRIWQRQLPNATLQAITA